MSCPQQSDIKRIVMRSRPAPGPNVKQCYPKNHYAGPIPRTSDDVDFWLDTLTKQGQRWSLVVDNADRFHIFVYSNATLPHTQQLRKATEDDGDGSWLNGEVVKC
jgi:hypothetical protein